MPRTNRATQFAPFDALKGLHESLKLAEYRHNKKQKQDIPEEQIDYISKVLQEIKKDSIVYVKFFSDGYEQEYTGNVSLNILEQKLKMSLNEIEFDDILDIKIL